MSQRTIGSNLSLTDRLEEYPGNDNRFDRHQTRTLLEEHGNNQDDLITVEEALGGEDTYAYGYVLLDEENREAAYLPTVDFHGDELVAPVQQKGDMSEVMINLAQSYRNNARINEDPEYLVE
jgi:hypothetical protein